jgi:hypothetical protein
MLAVASNKRRGEAMRWLVVFALLLLGACSSAERMSYQASSTGVGYDTTKEDKVPGGYRAQGVYDRAAAAKGEVSADEVKWRALYNGLEAAQKDGYDLATVAGPAATTLTKKITHTPTGTTLSSNQWPGFAYIIRGYKSGEAHPANARSIAALMDAANQRAFAAKPAGKK